MQPSTSEFQRHDRSADRVSELDMNTDWGDVFAEWNVAKPLAASGWVATGMVRFLCL
jgi:hypothetical protein